MSNKNRTKGHNAERHYAQLFRDLGFEECQTSRYTSRQFDDWGVDLTGLPFLVQIKAGKQRGMKPKNVLKNIHDNVSKSYKDYVKVLIHHKEGTRGKKRTEFDQIVSLTYDDFIKLIKKAYDIQD